MLSRLPGVGERVVDRDRVVGRRQHVADVVRSDESGRAGDEEFHGPLSQVRIGQ